MKRTVLVTPFVVAAVVAAFLLGGEPRPRPASAATPAAGVDEGVVVEGVGTTTGRPDVLHLTLSVSGGSADVTRALAAVDALAARVHSELRKAGAEGTRVQTSNVNVYPERTRSGRVFRVSEQLTAVLPVATAGKAISNSLTVGGKDVSLDAVSFALEKDGALLDRARTEAFADAKQKAERYARLAGRSLGKVLLVTETLRAPAVPYGGAALDSALRSAPAKALDLRLYGGTSELSVSVTVRWSLA